MYLKMWSVICFNLDQSKNLSFGNEFKPFPQQQNLDCSKLKDFADDNFEFHENDVKFFKTIENTVGKEENACYHQFLLFSRSFQKTCIADK